MSFWMWQSMALFPNEFKEEQFLFKLLWFDADDSNQQEQVKHIRQLKLDKIRVYSDVASQGH
jgi:hypothetical protein